MMLARDTQMIKADSGAARTAARILASGGLVAFPTETVYGLGADATDGAAVARLYAAKGRPAFNPLIAHVADIATARELACFDGPAERLAQAFWPGPLTMVLPKAPSCSVAELATAGLDTIAIRIPDHGVAHAILAAFGKPVVAPSANLSGHVSPTTAQHVLADLGGRIDLIVDGGATPVGVESTIVACLGTPMILRPGGLPRDAIAQVLGAQVLGQVLGQPLAEGPPAASGEGDAPLAPGMLASHYAPKAKLRLDANDVAPGEALLAFGPDLPPGANRARAVLNLSPSGDLIEAAANLFSHLRALDRAGVHSIAAMPISPEGLGEAINDRLQRAAAPR